MATTKNEMLDALLQRMDDALANGKRLPWQKPWEPQFGDLSAPHNPTTERLYSPLNGLILSTAALEHGYEDPRWMGFNQAKEQGWSVRRGEHAAARIFSPIIKNEINPKTGLEDPRVVAYRGTPLFNAAQIDGIPPMREIPEHERLPKTAELDAIAQQMGVSILHSGSGAFYSPGQDRIQLPPRDTFVDQHGYDATKAHELSHATGHESRLDRDSLRQYTSIKGRAAEEMTAEIGSYLLSTRLGVPFMGNNPDMTDAQHAAYLTTWARDLSPDERRAAIEQGIKAAGHLEKQLELARENGLVLGLHPAREVAAPELASTNALMVSRGDYVRYTDDLGQSREAIVLDNAVAGETARLRSIYRWPNGRPGLDGADHITPIILPGTLDKHIPGAVPDDQSLQAIDPITDAYKRNMGNNNERNKAEQIVLSAVEKAHGVAAIPEVKAAMGQKPEKVLSGPSDKNVVAMGDLMAGDFVRVSTSDATRHTDAIVLKVTKDGISGKIIQPVREKTWMPEPVRGSHPARDSHWMFAAGELKTELKPGSAYISAHEPNAVPGIARLDPLAKAGLATDGEKLALHMSLNRFMKDRGETAIARTSQPLHKITLTHRTDLKDRVCPVSIPGKPDLEMRNHPRQEISGVLKDFSKSEFILETPEFGVVRVETGKLIYVHDRNVIELRSVGKPLQGATPVLVYGPEPDKSHQAEIRNLIGKEVRVAADKDTGRLTVKARQPAQQRDIGLER
ncbi:MAG: zincin-like metallopeptidase domain-containing protein [Acidithiobacillus sp.]|nr:zincin-like metallopeptidase domain-containing protein [Acidithiobacillus sp.]